MAWDTEMALAIKNTARKAAKSLQMCIRDSFTDFMPLQDKSKNDLVRIEGGSYYVYGYPVLIDERVSDHEAYLADCLLYTSRCV